MLSNEGPNVTVEGFDGPLEMLLELVEEKKLDILTVRLGDLADAYLARVHALAQLPADEVASFLALAARAREDDMVAPGERYSVEERTQEIEDIVAERDEITFSELLGATPTLGWAVVTFIALLDLYRRVIIDLEQSQLFTDILIKRKTTSA